MKNIERSEAQTKSLLASAMRYARQYGCIGINDPDDIAQMAALKVLRQTHVQHIYPKWLKAVVRNTAHDVARKHLREASYRCDFGELQYDRGVCESSEEFRYAALAESSAVVEEPRDHYLIEELTSALEQLSDPLRQALLLHAEGYSYEEISRMTNANIGTVRSRLFNARRRARALLSQFA